MCSLSIFSSKPKLPDALKGSLLAVLVFIGLFFVCDRVIHFFLNAAFRRTTTLDRGGIVNKVLQEKCAIVVLGSSRAVLHYDPRILGSKLNMSAYNAGCNGQQVHYTRALVDLILQRQTPAIAIINVDTGFVMDARFNLCQAATMAPFMDESGIIKNMIYSKGPFERLKYLSLSYRFNDKPLVILASLFFEDKTISGFSPREGKVDPAKAQKKLTAFLEPDREMMELLRQTVSQLKEAGSYVVLVLSPTWNREGRIDPMSIPILKAIRDLAQDEQVSFLAVTNENTPEFQNCEYFRDPNHLNADGARIFSEILAAKIAGLMEKQFQNVYDDI
jgi:hypothetical protein